MKTVLFVLAILVAGCSEADQDKYWPRGTFELSNGDVVQCRWIDDTPCGARLHDCVGGGVYTCQHGVIER